MPVPNPGRRPMAVPANGHVEGEAPFMRLRDALNTLPFFMRYSVLRDALLPVVKAKAAELAEIDFNGEIRVRAAYINQHIDKLYYFSRESVVMSIAPSLIRSAERIQEMLNTSALLQTSIGRRIALLMATALLVELLSALPDTMRDGNQRLIDDVTRVIEADGGEE